MHLARDGTKLLLLRFLYHVPVKPWYQVSEKPEIVPRSRQGMVLSFCFREFSYHVPDISWYHSADYYRHSSNLFGGSMKTVDQIITDIQIPEALILLLGKSAPRPFFFDIETTGLRSLSCYIYLIGCLTETGDGLRSRQWFAENADEEPEIIRLFCEAIEPDTVLVHYNGNTFDIPFLQERIRLHKMHLSVPKKEETLDLFRHLSHTQKLFGLINRKQPTLEKVVGYDRTDPYDGGTLVAFYSEYVGRCRFDKARSEELLAALLLHNRDDILGLSQLPALLPYYCFPDLPLEDAVQAAKEDTVTFTATLPLRFRNRFERFFRFRTFRHPVGFTRPKRAVKLPSDQVPTAGRSFPFRRIPTAGRWLLLVPTTNRFLPFHWMPPPTTYTPTCCYQDGQCGFWSRFTKWHLTISLRIIRTIIICPSRTKQFTRALQHLSRRSFENPQLARRQGSKKAAVSCRRLPSRSGRRSGSVTRMNYAFLSSATLMRRTSGITS